MARKDFVRINGFDDKVSQIGLFVIDLYTQVSRV